MASRGGMTDVTGYRADSGGLGQDQEVSSQLRSILTSKLPLLSSPGSVIENNLYYDVTSSSVSAVEMQATFAKDRIVMSNMSIGSSPAAYIPSQLFSSTVFWVVQVPNILCSIDRTGLVDGNAGALRFYAPEGWGFNALQSVIIYMGASSIAQIEIDWYANFMISLATCETSSKKQAMIAAAGMLMDNYAVGTAIPAITAAYPAKGESIFYTNAHTDQAAILSSYGVNQYAYEIPNTTAVTPVRLPFCSMAVLEKKLSFDTKLLSQPIQITLQTKQPSQIFITGGNLTAPTNWANSTLQMWQEELSDKSLSVRNELLAMPEFNVGYPFQYSQSLPFSFPTSDKGEGNTTYSGNSFNQQQITMNITSIINSDLTTMLFMVTNGLRQAPNSLLLAIEPGDAPNRIDVNQFSPLFGERLSNMQLLLNGQRFYAFDQGIYDGVSLAKQLSDVTFKVPMPYLNKAGKVVPHLNQNFENNEHSFSYEKSHVYELNFSRLRSIIAESHLQNTARFTNQTFQLSFNVERSQNYIQNAGASLDDYLGQCAYKMELHMCYLYNAVFLAGGDGGTTKLVTN
jgi:hypothetical protein